MAASATQGGHKSTMQIKFKTAEIQLWFKNKVRCQLYFEPSLKPKTSLALCLNSV